MSNAHVPEPFRSLLNDLTRNHRIAHEELREGMAAINRVNRQTMSDEELPQAISESVIKIAGLELRVAVLDDGRRVFVDDENLRLLFRELAELERALKGEQP